MPPTPTPGRAAQVAAQARQNAAQNAPAVATAHEPAPTGPEGQDGHQEGQEGEGGSLFSILGKQLLQDVATSVVKMLRLSSEEARKILDEVQV